MPEYFHSLNTPVAANDISSILGRFVRDPNDPNIDSNDTPPFVILKEDDYSIPVRAIGDWTTKSDESRKLWFGAGKLFEMSKTNSSSTQNSILHSITTTLKLKHYRQSFDMFCDKRIIEIELRRLAKGSKKIYMVTGLETVVHCEGGYVKASWSEIDGSVQNGRIPITEVARSLNIVIPSGLVDPQLGMEAKNKHTYKSKFKWEGEQITRVQCHPVRIKGDEAQLFPAYSNPPPSMLKAMLSRPIERVKFKGYEYLLHLRYPIDRVAQFEAIADVVFVGGMKKFPKGVWTGLPGKPFWPATLGEADLEKIRISEFLYPSGADDQVGAEIRGYARELLVSLKYHYGQFREVSCLFLYKSRD